MAVGPDPVKALSLGDAAGSEGFAAICEQVAHLSVSQRLRFVGGMLSLGCKIRLAVLIRNTLLS